MIDAVYIVQEGLYADVLRFDRSENDPNGEYLYVVQVRNFVKSKVNISCTNYTGAVILADVLNRVLPAPTLSEHRAGPIFQVSKEEKL